MGGRVRQNRCAFARGRLYLCVSMTLHMPVCLCLEWDECLCDAYSMDVCMYVCVCVCVFRHTNILLLVFILAYSCGHF